MLIYETENYRIVQDEMATEYVPQYKVGIWASYAKKNGETITYKRLSAAKTFLFKKREEDAIAALSAFFRNIAKEITAQQKQEAHEKAELRCKVEGLKTRVLFLSDGTWMACTYEEMNEHNIRGVIMKTYHPEDYSLENPSENESSHTAHLNHTKYCARLFHTMRAIRKHARVNGEELSLQESKYRAIRLLVQRDILEERPHPYTMETLRADNRSYCNDHLLNQSDLEKVNALVCKIEATRRADRPVDGDMIVCVSPKHGVIAEYGHIQEMHAYPGWMTICTDPYIPFINESLRSNASGGYWISAKEQDIPRFEYVGTTEKMFCTWGHYGMCAHGAIDFQSRVNVWRYKDEHFY